MMHHHKHPQKKNVRKRTERQCFIKMYGDFLEAMRPVVSSQNEHDEIISQRLRELKRPRQAMVLRQKFIDTMRPITIDNNSDEIDIQRIIEYTEPVEIIPGIDFRKLCRDMSSTSIYSLKSFLTCLCVFTGQLQLTNLDVDSLLDIIKNDTGNDNGGGNYNMDNITHLVQNMCGFDNTNACDRAFGSLITDMAQKLIDDPTNFIQAMSQTNNNDDDAESNSPFSKEELDKYFNNLDSADVKESIERLMSNMQQPIEQMMGNIQLPPSMMNEKNEKQ